MALMEERDEGTGIALGRLFPINALTLEVKSTKDRLIRFLVADYT